MKRLVKTIILLTLLIITITGIQFVNLIAANPYRYDYKTISPPSDAIPIQITVISPHNLAMLNTNDVTLAFNVSDIGTSISFLYDVHFKASWLQDNVTVFKQDSYSPQFPNFESYNETFHGLPDGNYSVLITACGGGYIVDSTKFDVYDGTAYYFDMTTRFMLNFTIATPPKISVLSPQNETYDFSTIPLNFTVNETISQISYVLDGKETISINGNITLPDLSNGEHNVIVYATDEAGNVGSSETLTFTIAKSVFFVLITTSIGVVAIAVASLLIYFKKHKRG